MEELGKGSSGIVYKGRWRNLEVAVKKMGGLTDEQLNLFIQEAELLISIHPHENVILMYGVCRIPACIVTKFHKNGNLLRYLQVGKPLTNVQIFGIIKGIAAGMSHLHSEKIIHRDLAARNILLTASMEAVVSDFGFARAVASENDSRSTQTQAFYGPLKWMAPEALERQVYSVKTDVWAYGVTVWEILTRKEPYGNMNLPQTTLAVMTGKTKDHLQFPDTTAEILVDLLHRCWAMDPDERPTFQVIYDELRKIEKIVIKSLSNY